MTNRKINNFKKSIQDFNKQLDKRAADLMYIYDGNPYCHEYSLGWKLECKGNELIKALEEYMRKFLYDCGRSEAIKQAVYVDIKI